MSHTWLSALPNTAGLAPPPPPASITLVFTEQCLELLLCPAPGAWRRTFALDHLRRLTIHCQIGSEVLAGAAAYVPSRLAMCLAAAGASTSVTPMSHRPTC